MLQTASTQPQIAVDYKKMDEIKETGGARIGMANASWPFATLTVNKEKLELNATILGKLVFKPSDIVSIEPDSSFFRSGLKINHNVPTYKNNVVFVTGNASNLIKRIDQIGFLTNSKPITRELSNAIEASQATGGFPIKTSAAIAIVLIWNIFFW